MGRPMGGQDSWADKELLSQRVSPLEPNYMISKFKLNPDTFAAELVAAGEFTTSGRDEVLRFGRRKSQQQRHDSPIIPQQQFAILWIGTECGLQPPKLG